MIYKYINKKDSLIMQRLSLNNYIKFYVIGKRLFIKRVLFADFFNTCSYLLFAVLIIVKNESNVLSNLVHILFVKTSCCNSGSIIIFCNQSNSNRCILVRADRVIILIISMPEHYQTYYRHLACSSCRQHLTKQTLPPSIFL